jgi:hypothetical protein
MGLIHATNPLLNLPPVLQVGVVALGVNNLRQVAAAAGMIATVSALASFVAAAELQAQVCGMYCMDDAPTEQLVFVAGVGDPDGAAKTARKFGKGPARRGWSGVGGGWHLVRQGFAWVVEEGMLAGLGVFSVH